MSKILLSGVPGAGKSTVARHIESDFGFVHVDMERNDFASRREFKQNPDDFIGRLAVHDNVILSWGFGPFQDRAAIDHIREKGYTLVWLDGDRSASYREFMRREHDDPVMEAMYYGQMQMIVVTDIIKALAPIIVNPFMDSGTFRPVEDIALDVVGSVQK